MAEHTYTRFVFDNETHEDCEITGTLDQQWFIDKGWFSEDELEWNVTFIEIDIGSTVENIGDGALAEQIALGKIHIPDTVKSIGNGTFYGCTKLANEEGFVIVRDWLYDYRNDGTKIRIPGNVTNIGDGAFNWCETIEEVFIPNSVKYIGEGVFDGCDKLMYVNAEKTKAEILSMNYPSWELYPGCVIHCQDGDITIE